MRSGHRRGAIAAHTAARKLIVATLAAMIIAGVAPAGASAATTRFKPDAHGFEFENKFSVRIGLRFPKPLGLKSINLGKHGYGLCGGMSYAALDYFLAGKPIPPDVTQPRLGSPLYNYIFRRQRDSFTPGTLAKFATYPLRTTTDLTRRSRRSFQDVIRKRLDRGSPVPLGLIKTKGLDNIVTGNHQVLAIGYSTRPITIKTETCVLGICKKKSRRDNEPIVAIYDPNYPNKITYLHTNHHVQTMDKAGNQKLGRVRGYFPTPYNRRQPPPPPAPLPAPAPAAPEPAPAPAPRPPSALPAPSLLPSPRLAPDLVITGIRQLGGGCCDIRVTVRNEGNVSAVASKTEITQEGRAPALLDTPPLAPGQSTTIVGECAYGASGNVIARADATNLVSESNEDNNIATGGVGIVGEGGISVCRYP